ncbi:MAG: AAA family ATPase [Deltaproteobacteria bacterium]|nr:AAA family ATPase [Deltaproteobacteria bacterium]
MTAPPSDVPSEVGPFVVSRELARGGMSVVYVAHPRGGGPEVALKTVRVPDEVYLASMRREIHALSRLRHPGVVRIVAEGLNEGVPWYAMEYLEGETLADLRAKLWSGPSRAAAGGQLDRVLAIVRRLCAPLAFLHGEGVVHCDLKPQNVILRAGDHPVLVDFGLAWRAAGLVGREVAAAATKLVGTPAYMAPEQIRLEPIDPRTDLYALGCVLYELITGRPPFEGHDVLVRHLTSEPLPPSQRVDGVPAALDAMVLALLAKRPRDRIGYAEDVIHALDRLGAAPDEPPPPRARVWLYRPEIAGREAMVEGVLGGVRGAANGEGGFVFLTGPSGIGKTYLAAEIARRLAPDLQVIASACAPPGAIRRGELEPFQALLDAVADRCTSLGVDAVDRLLGPRAKVLAPYAPRLGRLPGVAELPDPPELAGNAAREQLFSALRGALAALARERPLLLLLDDLQWADELSLAFLASLPRGWLAAQPAAILGLARADHASEALAAIAARPDVRDVAVGPLDHDDVRQVVRDMLAVEAPPEPFVGFLARHSAGNPYFVAEYLRAAVADGVLRRASPFRLLLDDTTAALELPRTLRGLVSRRLHALPAFAQPLLEVASVIGPGFDAETLQRASAVSDEAAMEGVAELLARQIIEPLQGGRFQFVHDQVREVAYDAIEPARRAALHGAVARAIEAGLARSGDEGALAPVLARHWSLAHEDREALEWTERAAWRALDHAAHGEAVALLRRALELVERARPTAARWSAPRPARRARLEAALARASFAAGDQLAAERHAERSLAEAGRPLPRTRAGWGVLLGRELATQALHLSGVVRRRARDPGAREVLRGAAETAALLTQRYFYVDDALAMLSASVLSANLAERAGAETRVPRAYTTLGFTAGALGLTRLAASYFARARAGAEALHDPLEVAYAWTVEGVHLSGRGLWAAAEEAIDRASGLLEGLYDPLTAELTLTARGHIEFYTGRVERAEHRFEELLRAAQARGSAQHETWARFSIARSRLSRGRPAEARPLLSRACADLESRPELQSEIICYGLLADTEARLGDLVAARRAADQARARIERANPTGFAALEGYRGAIAAYLAVVDAGGPDADSARRAAERLVVLLARLARLFPMASASVAQLEGELARRRGRTGAARRAFRRALERSRVFGLPREEAEALLALGPAGA